MDWTKIERKVAAWVDYFTPRTFVSDDERDNYRQYVEYCFANERQPLWPLDWRRSLVTPTRGRHAAGN